MISGVEAIGLVKKSGVVLICAALLMLVGGVLGGIIGYGKGKADCQPIAADTITIVKVDSAGIQGTAARPDADSLIRIDSVPYPVPYPVPVYVDGETVIIHDTIDVYLTREHRLFSVPDTCDIWYSGVDPKIDSINLYYHHTTEIINHHIADISKTMPRLTAELGAGAFYHESRVNPYAVAKMSYNAPHVTFGAYGAVNHEGKWAAGLNVTYRLNIIK